MAGLTKQQLAGKAAFLKSDPPPTGDWKDLTPEEQQEWIDRAEPGNGVSTTVADTTASTPPAPAAPSAETPLAIVGGPDPVPAPPAPAGAPAPAPAPALAPAVEAPRVSDPMPGTDPEHGDLTPEWVRWYFRNHSADAFRGKYAGRLELIPTDVASALEGATE